MAGFGSRGRSGGAASGAGGRVKRTVKAVGKWIGGLFKRS